MKSTILTLVLFVSTFCANYGQILGPGVITPCSELFISELYFEKTVQESEYYEYAYAIEIYNPSEETIYLDNYHLVFTNEIGNMSFMSINGDSIMSGDVYVVANTNTTHPLENIADELMSGLDLSAIVRLE